MKLVCVCSSSWVWDDGFAKLLVRGSRVGSFYFLLSAMTTFTLFSRQSNINWSCLKTLLYILPSCFKFLVFFWSCACDLQHYPWGDEFVICSHWWRRNKSACKLSDVFSFIFCKIYLSTKWKSLQNEKQF